jgi:hypothetical protein
MLIGMASTFDQRNKFISTVGAYILKYGLDGVDIDWQYPSASDRSGLARDADNLASLVKEMRNVFDFFNPGLEISVTLPSSYHYLRGFSLNALQENVNYFNFMGFDFAGSWEQGVESSITARTLTGHTDLSKIDQGLDVLWRNGIDPKNVVLGFSFFGKTYTLNDISCSTPNGVCLANAEGVAGTCSKKVGMLLYSEIVSRNSTLNRQTFYDAQTTTKYNVYAGNQWVSYDDAQSFQDKMKFLDSRCLGGLMIWTIDQDTEQHDALSALLGDEASEGALLKGGELDDSEKAQLSIEFAAYTGQNCFVTSRCTNGSPEQSGSREMCPGGYASIATAHAPLQAPHPLAAPLEGDCLEGSYRHICCPVGHMPQSCNWEGTPASNDIHCSGHCGPTQFELAIDRFNSPSGNAACYQSHRSLCCDSTQIIDECFWTSCQGPISGNPTCPAGSKFMTYRYDNVGGEYCSQALEHSPVTGSYKRAFCCPEADAPKTCEWSQDHTDQGSSFDPDAACRPKTCLGTQIEYTKALDPPQSPILFSHATAGEINNCSSVPLRPGSDPNFHFCCDPSPAYNEKWPVDPQYLWANPYKGKEDDIQWAYVDTYGTNNKDLPPAGDTDSNSKGSKETTGSDPFGFVMLDGPPGTIASAFPQHFTISRRSSEIPIVKRSLLTTNASHLDQVFVPKTETIFVYCNYPRGSPECDSIFIGGAEDTIISLPDHVGEGPYGRIVSMEPADGYELPGHHARDRHIKRNTNIVYKVTYDYSFHLSKRAEEVKVRVDYTNLLTYWDTVTSVPKSKRKRDVLGNDLSHEEWKKFIRSARAEHQRLRKRNVPEEPEVKIVGDLARRDPTGLVARALEKRWFGAFGDWLARVTTVEAQNKGVLDMIWRNSMLLYHAAKGCQKSTA